MMARVLPPEEWDRLERFPMVPGVPVEDTHVIVVENDGAILGQLVVYRATHLEGLRLDGKRRGPHVVDALLRCAFKTASDLGCSWAYVHTEGGAKKLTRILGRRKRAVPVPVETFMVALRR